MKQGGKVKFSSRSRSGTGVIIGVKDTERGKFFEVKPDDGSKNISLRAAQLTAI